MAGFEVTLYGRICGDHRGNSTLFASCTVFRFVSILSFNTVPTLELYSNSGLQIIGNGTKPTSADNFSITQITLSSVSLTLKTALVIPGELLYEASVGKYKFLSLTSIVDAKLVKLREGPAFNGRFAGASGPFGCAAKPV
jgi:hypothetical protein